MVVVQFQEMGDPDRPHECDKLELELHFLAEFYMHTFT